MKFSKFLLFLTLLLLYFLHLSLSKESLSYAGFNHVTFYLESNNYAITLYNSCQFFDLRTLYRNIVYLCYINSDIYILILSLNNYSIIPSYCEMSRILNYMDQLYQII